MSPRTIFHIDVDAFFASVEEALDPSLKGKPVIVGGKGNDRGVVACPNYEARKLGVKTAMPLRTASQLAPQAIFIPGNFERYHYFSQEILKILYSFSPDLEPMSLDESFLDATGCLHFWDSVEAMARAIKKKIQENLSVTVSIGAASNKTCAKIASDFQKPDGLTIIPLGKEKEFLAPLPVEKIPGVGEKTSAVFHQKGITTIGELAATRCEFLHELFGVRGDFLFEVANGMDSREVSWDESVKSVSRSTTLEHDTTDDELIEALLFYLTERCCKRLRELRRCARAIAVTVRYSDFSTFTRHRTLRLPSNYDALVYQAVIHLFQEFVEWQQPIRLVGVRVSELCPVSDQGNVFSLKKNQLARLYEGIDRMREKFGYSIIYPATVMRLPMTESLRIDGFRVRRPSLSRS